MPEMPEALQGRVSSLPRNGRPLPAPTPQVICRRVSDGAVLLDVQREVYYGLNSVAVEIWELLAAGCRDASTLHERLSAQYPDVEPEVLQADVRALVDDLLRHGLLTETDADLEPRAEAARVGPLAP